MNHGQIEPAFCGLDVGDVANPLLIRPGSCKILVEQVGSSSGTRLLPGGLWMPMGSFYRHQVSFFHQARHTMTGIDLSSVQKVLLNADTAIGAAAECKGFPDLFKQGLIGLLPDTQRPLFPGIETN